MPRLTRRGFLKTTGGGVATGAIAVATGRVANAQETASTAATLPYEKRRVAALNELCVGQPVDFHYPDDASPCIMLKLGKAAPGGVGPDGDVVAYSMLCTHQGCPVNFDPSTVTLKCPCHYSIFDAELGGQMVVGQATENLPQITLEVDQNDGSIHAVAVNGLIYGRQSNIV